VLDRRIRKSEKHISAGIDPALMQKILQIPEQKWRPDVQHQRKADDGGARLEIAEQIEFCHS